MIKNRYKYAFLKEVNINKVSESEKWFYLDSFVAKDVNIDCDKVKNYYNSFYKLTGWRSWEKRLFYCNEECILDDIEKALFDFLILIVMMTDLNILQILSYFWSWNNRNIAISL